MQHLAILGKLQELEMTELSRSLIEKINKLAPYGNSGLVDVVDVIAIIRQHNAATLELAASPIPANDDSMGCGETDSGAALDMPEDEAVQKVFDIIEGCKHYWDASVAIVRLLREPPPIQHIAESDRVHCKDCCCAKSWEALEITEYSGKSIPEHIRELKAAMGAPASDIAQCDKDLGQKTKAYVVQSEISLVEEHKLRAKIFDIICSHDVNDGFLMGEIMAEIIPYTRATKLIDAGINYLDIRNDLAELSAIPTMAITANDHIKIIGEKLRAIKPVLVSLEKCVLAAFNTCCIGTIHQARTATKAVLDAAGVKYAD